MGVAGSLAGSILCFFKVSFFLVLLILALGTDILINQIDRQTDKHGGLDEFENIRNSRGLG